MERPKSQGKLSNLDIDLKSRSTNLTWTTTQVTVECKTLILVSATIISVSERMNPFVHSHLHFRLAALTI